MYKTILVPHAGTIEGDGALKHAIFIAKQSSSSKIILLHVIEDLPHVPVFSLHASQISEIKKEVAKITKDMKSAMTKEIEKRMKICKRNKVKSSSKIVIGTPAKEILKIVKQQKIELIIMAKRRKLKGLKSLLTLGSVSRKIVENTSCPVLLVDVENK